MKAVIQRVNFAQVTVDQQIVGAIDQGILVYLGLGHDDNLAIGKKMIDKIILMLLIKFKLILFLLRNF